MTPAPDATVDDANDSGEIPCAPRQVLQTVCEQCHTTPARNGAPFPLVTRKDAVAHRADMIDQIQARRMPLTPVTMDDDARSILLNWLQAGAPAATTQQCVDAAQAGDATADAPDDAGSDADSGDQDVVDAADASDAGVDDADAGGADSGDD